MKLTCKYTYIPVLFFYYPQSRLFIGRLRTALIKGKRLATRLFFLARSCCETETTLRTITTLPSCNLSPLLYHNLFPCSSLSLSFSLSLSASLIASRSRLPLLCWHTHTIAGQPFTHLHPEIRVKGREITLVTAPKTSGNAFVSLSEQQRFQTSHFVRRVKTSKPITPWRRC